VDELGRKLEAGASDIEAALAQEKGEVGFDFVHADEVTVTGDRIGFARLAVEALRAAAPPVGVSESEIRGGDERLLDSPINDFRRNDLAPAPRARMSWKDRLFAAGCFLFAAIAIVAFFRGCVALESDVTRWLQ
jgi:hypothetical protein